MNNINDYVTDIKEGLLETKLTVTQLGLNAKHLLIDPKDYLKALDCVQENTAMIADMCGSLPKIMNRIIESSSNTIIQQIEQLHSIKEDTPPSDTASHRIHAEALDTLSERVETLARENKDLSEASSEQIKDFNKKLDELISMKEETQMCHSVFEKIPAALNELVRDENDLLTQVSENVQTLLSTPAPHMPTPAPDRLPPAPEKPVKKLTPGYLKEILLQDLKEWLNEQDFTRLGKREVLYVGEYDYWYGGVKHKAKVPPKVVRRTFSTP